MAYASEQERLDAQTHAEALARRAESEMSVYRGWLVRYPGKAPALTPALEAAVQRTKDAEDEVDRIVESGVTDLSGVSVTS